MTIWDLTMPLKKTAENAFIRGDWVVTRFSTAIPILSTNKFLKLTPSHTDSPHRTNIFYLDRFLIKKFMASAWIT